MISIKKIKTTNTLITNVYGLNSFIKIEKFKLNILFYSSYKLFISNSENSNRKVTRSKDLMKIWQPYAAQKTKKFKAKTIIIKRDSFF